MRESHYYGCREFDAVVTFCRLVNEGWTLHYKSELLNCIIAYVEQLEIAQAQLAILSQPTKFNDHPCH